MALGITRVRTSSDMVGNDCIMSGSVDYVLENTGWYQIGACIYANCYAFSEAFEVKYSHQMSGSIDLYETEEGHGFWALSDTIDVSLINIDVPFSYPGSIVGTQKTLSFEECATFCTPGTRVCEGNDVYECNTSGSSYNVFIETCSSGCTNGVCDFVPISIDSVVCEGFKEDCSPYRVENIFGKTLYNSTTYPDICDWFDYACDFNCSFIPYNETSSFDLSYLTRNEHEVATVYTEATGLTANGQYNILAKWYDPDNNHLFTNNTGYFTGTPSYMLVVWAGYCDWEISVNGTYKVIVELHEDDSIIMTKTLYFDITGISCPFPECGFDII